MYKSTAVLADALCYVTQCYHYKPEGLFSSQGLYYFGMYSEFIHYILAKVK